MAYMCSMQCGLIGGMWLIGRCPCTQAHAPPNTMNHLRIPSWVNLDVSITPKLCTVKNISGWPHHCGSLSQWCMSLLIRMTLEDHQEPILKVWWRSNFILLRFGEDGGPNTCWILVAKICNVEKNAFIGYVGQGFCHVRHSLWAPVTCVTGSKSYG